MPFGPKNLPSLGLSILKPILQATGFIVEVRYGTVAFAEALGAEAYETISDSSSDLLLGDWVFADLIRVGSEPDATSYMASLRRKPSGRAFEDAARRARALARPFVESIVREILTGEPSAVAFTSTFAQNAASLAAARLIKELRPELAIVFGGANCEGEMGLELVRRFPFVDAAVSGEGETVAAELFLRLSERAELFGLGGVYTPADPPERRPETAPRIADLDLLPIPDYHDFMSAMVALRPETAGLEPHLLVEASRGCWWGEKQHCTFCGLNGSALTFRSKSADRFVDEVLFLAGEYGTAAFSAVDNILDHRYFKTVLPRLADSDAGVNLFFEVKSNLKRDQVELLHRSGVRAIQAGIESLDSGVLALMRKGVSAIQNVQLLRLCKELGIRVAWNLLYGFPDEDPAAYRRMAELIPLLVHLRPPDVATRIRLDRFSPFFEQREALGIQNVRPMSAYADVYGGSPESLARLAYYFDFDYIDGRDVDAYTADFCAAVERWQRVHDDSDLAMLDGGADLILVDRRMEGEGRITLLSGLDRKVYLACDQIQTVPALAGAVAQSFPRATVDEIANLCRRLVDDGLMLEESGRMLALGVDVSRGGVGRGLREQMLAEAPALI